MAARATPLVSGDNHQMRRALAIALALGGLLIAAGAMIRVAWALQAGAYRQPLWPLPGLYLIEVAALASVVFLAVVIERTRLFASAWVAVGALMTLMVLGAMTIGPFIATALFLFLPALVISGGPNALKIVGALAVGAMLQAGAMLAVIQTMIR